MTVTEGIQHTLCSVKYKYKGLKKTNKKNSWTVLETNSAGTNR
jgi:hypothetical protein